MGWGGGERGGGGGDVGGGELLCTFKTFLK